MSKKKKEEEKENSTSNTTTEHGSADKQWRRTEYTILLKIFSKLEIKKNKNTVKD